MKHTSGKPPVVELIADAVDEACSDKPTFTQLVSRLKEKNIIVHPKLDNQNNILGIAYEMNDVKIAGYQIGKGYSFPGLQKYLGVVYGESGQQPISTNKRRRKRLTDAASIKRITASIEPIAAILNTVGGESSVGRESTSIDKIGDSQSVTDDASVVESIIDSEPINNQPDRSDSEDRTTTSNQQPNIGQPSNPVKPTKGNRKNQRSNSETREVVAEEVPIQDNAVGADIHLQGASEAVSNHGSNIRSNSLDTDTFSATKDTQPHQQQGKQSGDSIAKDRGQTEEISTESIPNYSNDWLTKLQQEPLFQNLVKETGSEAKAIYIIGEIIKQQGAITPDTTIQPEPTLEVVPEKSNISTRSTEKSASQQFSIQASDAAQQQQYANQIASVIRKYWELQGNKRKHYKSDRHELLLSNETYILKRTSGETIAIIPLDPNKTPQGQGLTLDEVEAFLDFYSEKLKQLEMQQKTQKNQAPQQLRQQQSHPRKHSLNRSDSGIDL